jgi:Rrf2 family protein
MKISAKAEYALRAVNYLAHRYGEGYIQLKEISGHEGIPLKFLEQILTTLKNAEILESKSGPGGGYYLGKHPSEVTVARIIETMDVSTSPVDCLNECDEFECVKNRGGDACGLRWLWQDIKEETIKILENTTIQDLCDRKAKAPQGTGGGSA